MQLLLIDNDKGSTALLQKLIIRSFPQFSVQVSNDLKHANEYLLIDDFYLVITETIVDGKPVFDFLHRKQQRIQHVLFFTTNEQLTYDGYRLKNVVGYELKPITKAVLKRNIFKSIFGNHIFTTDWNKPKNTFIANTKDELILVNRNHIIRFESDKMGVFLISEHIPPFLINSTLKILENKLYQKLFFRAHQSHLINLNAVKQFLLNRNTLKMANGDRIPVSQRKKQHILQALKTWYLFE